MTDMFVRFITGHKIQKQILDLFCSALTHSLSSVFQEIHHFNLALKIELDFLFILPLDFNTSNSWLLSLFQKDKETYCTYPSGVLNIVVKASRIVDKIILMENKAAWSSGTKSRYLLFSLDFFFVICFSDNPSISSCKNWILYILCPSIFLLLLIAGVLFYCKKKGIVYLLNV